MSCVSSTESLAICAAGASTMAKAGLDRLGDLIAGRPPVERRQAAWDANAEFLAGLGHDPVLLLGARPVAPVPVPASEAAVAAGSLAFV